MIDPKVISPSDKNEIKKEGRNLEEAGVVPLDRYDPRDKPARAEESERETNKMTRTTDIEEGKATAATKDVGKLNQQSTDIEQDKEVTIENARKEKEIELAAAKTEEFAKELKKTQEARERQPETQEELLKRQQEQEELVAKQTKEHEEKQEKEVSAKKEHAVLHGGATRESMKEEEKSMNLRPDATPSMKEGGEKEYIR